MGLLLTKLWRFFISNEEHKVIIVGLDNAGKTTILYQYLMGEVVHTSPTIGSNVEEVIWRNIHFLMWDIGGQETLRASWTTYYANTEFLILVIDSTDSERLSVSKQELYRMLSNEDLTKAAVLIFANKQDVKGCMSAAEISKELNLTSLKTHRYQIQPCCALTGEGYKNAICFSYSDALFGKCFGPSSIQLFHANKVVARVGMDGFSNKKMIWNRNYFYDSAECFLYL